MRILGIDPGTATTGYAIVEQTASGLRPVEYGTIRTSPRKTAPERLAEIHEAVEHLLDRWHVDCLATERIFFARNEKTAFSVGRTIGVVLLAAAEHGVGWAEYTPMEVKLAVVGYGAADKRQVQYMVQRILSLEAPPNPDDAADALAVAICHAHMASRGHALGVPSNSGTDSDPENARPKGGRT